MKCLGWTVGVVLLLSLLGAAAAQPSQAERQIDDAKAKGLSACVMRGDHLVATALQAR